MKRKNWTFLLMIVGLASALLLTLALESLHAATVPDIRGTWTSGPSSVTVTGCQDPDDNGVYFDPGGDTYSITNQTGANFSFTIVVSESQGGNTIMQTETCSGTVAVDGTDVVTVNGGFWYSGIDTLTGSLTGNSLTYTGAGQDLAGDTCQYNYSTATDTRSGPVPPPIVLPMNTPYDLNGDGKGDLTWRNTNTGSTAVWLMNGIARASIGFPGGVPLNWQIAGIGDVTGDGKADVIWRNGTNGAVAIWVMNGTIVTSTGFPGSTSTDWRIAGVGDFNGNGKADLIWKNDTSDIVAIWLMNGTSIASSKVLGGIASAWKIEQVGDMNGDGKADVVLKNTSTGEVKVWLMNGVALIGIGSPDTVSLSWDIQP